VKNAGDPGLQDCRNGAATGPGLAVIVRSLSGIQSAHQPLSASNAAASASPARRLEVEERPDPRLASDCTPAPSPAGSELRRSCRSGHVVPTDPHQPQVGNLKISGDRRAAGAA
jgi:hypothetical protein